MSIGRFLKKAVSIDTITTHHEYIAALRGLATLPIIAVHVCALPNLALGPLSYLYVSHMGIGVPLFYLLSAYTLCLSMNKRKDSGIDSFYIRRFFRIAPLFYSMLALYVIYKILILKNNVSIAHIITNMLFVFNFIPQDSRFEGIVWASWSIGVEMPFYLIFPFLLKRSRNISRSLIIFLAALVISYAFRLGLHLIVTKGMTQDMLLSAEIIRKYGYMSLLATFPYFMLGIITFHIRNYINSNKKRSYRLISKIFLGGTFLALILLPHLHEKYMLNPFPLNYVYGLFFVALVLSLSIHKNAFLVNRLTVFWGEISYSMYLVHPVVIVVFAQVGIYYKIYSLVRNDLLAFACCCLLTILAVTIVSIFTYKFIEFPGMKLGRIIDQRVHTARELP